MIVFYYLKQQVYKEGIVKLSINCAKEAAKQNVKKFIEISDGHVHSSEKVSILMSFALSYYTDKNLNLFIK